MRTAFTFDDDKQLVQLARSYIDAGSRIPWNDVAHQMRSSKHTAAALRQRLQSLFRTWGRYITRFPTNFFSVVRRQRGRPPAVLQRLRAYAASSQTHGAHPTTTTTAATRPPSTQTPSAPAPSTTKLGLTNDATKSVKAPVTRQQVLPVSSSSGTDGDALPDIVSDEESNESVDDDALPSAPPSVDQYQLPLSPSSAEEAVTSMFADVPRASIAHSGATPHLNVGELLPGGVTTMLQELGEIDETDVFFDIGAGLGNIVAQVVFETKISKAIAIEVNTKVFNTGVEMIAKSPYRRDVQERVEFFCGDVTGLCFSRIPPFELATIVFWNNILFEPVTIEFVNRELSEMVQVRLFMSTAPMCPRHRETCFSEFCSSIELFKEVELICSWKAEPQRAYFYRAY